MEDSLWPPGKMDRRRTLATVVIAPAIDAPGIAGRATESSETIASHADASSSRGCACARSNMSRDRVPYADGTSTRSCTPTNPAPLQSVRIAASRQRMNPMSYKPGKRLWGCSEPGCQNTVSNPTTLRCRTCWAKAEHRRVALSTCALDGCEAPIRSKGLCELHYRRPSDSVHHKQRNRCQVCDVPVSDEATLCRTHYVAAKKPQKVCKCGNPLSTPRAIQCRTCWMRDHMAQDSRPRCKTCKTVISWGGRGGIPTYCKPCYAEYRKSLPKRLCSLKGCNLAHWSKGFCTRHYPGAGDSRGIRNYLAELPCAVCGLDDPDVIQIDRVVREKGYTWGNVIQVCANCHMKITRGTIERPPPWEAPPSTTDSV